MFLPPWVSHKRQSSPRPEYAMQPCFRLRRCECPLAIAIDVNRCPELRERPALFVAPRFDAHIEEDIERFLSRQPAVLPDVVDHVGIGALDILRIDLEMLDQGLFRALPV